MAHGKITQAKPKHFQLHARLCALRKDFPQILVASCLQMPTLITEGNWRVASIIQSKFTKNAHTHKKIQY